MPCNIKNPANIDLTEIEGLVQDLYTHVYNRVGFNKPPTMVFDSDPGNEKNILGKTAYYDPNTLEIHVYSDGRHPKDMLRSIAHELIHHWQNEEGRLDVGGYSGPGYYLKNKDLKKLEDEAMLLGNGYFREFEDNLKLKEKKEMSLNEWKNNELNRLLMKKFGILKESGVPMSPTDQARKRGENPKGFWGDDKPEEAAEKPDEKEKLKEDSGEEEGEHYDKNKMSDDDHIKAIEHHLAALKKDRDYDDDHEEERYDEHRNRKDKLVGHDDRDPEGLVVGEGKSDDDDEPLEENNPTGSLDNAEKGDGIDAMLENEKGGSLKESIRKILKKNKKIRLRFKK